jgi:hypothetical protein
LSIPSPVRGFAAEGKLILKTAVQGRYRIKKGIEATLIWVFIVMVLACASGNQDNDPNTTQSEAPTSVVRLLKGTSALLAGEWTIDKTFAAVSSPSPIDCLSADIQFLQARAGNTGPLRIDANVTFTCVGASILSPPTWKGLRPEDIYIEDAAGNQSRNTGIGGIFGKNVTKP